MKLRLVVLAAMVVVGLGTYFLVAFFAQPERGIPSEFSEARGRGAELARIIVSLSETSLKNLEEISRYDEEGKKAEALILISQEVIRNRSIREEALRLSSQLEKMARYLSDISPERARILATEAVSSEVALVGRLLVYNELLLRLFETLKDKLEKPSLAANGRVQTLVEKINEEGRAINEFNRKFVQSLADFDAIVNR